MSHKKPESKERQVIGLLGVGLDNQDGEHRITRGEEFVLVGGSPETHEHMQETALKFAEALRRRGKRLQETNMDEVIELFYEARE